MRPADAADGRVKPFDVVIADDERPARSKLVRLLAADARFTLVAEAADGAEALARIEELRPALAILDVQMPRLTGLEVIDALGPDGCPELIFSTAFDRYALAAFDAAAVDYLLKPYDATRFARALDRAFARLSAGAPPDAGVQSLVTRAQPLERLVIKRGDAWVPLPVAEIWRIAAADKYVRVFSARGEELVRQSLSSLEARLDPCRFVRVHRSDIVALDAVVRLEPWSHGDALLYLRDGGSVVLSRTYRDAFVRRWRG